MLLIPHRLYSVFPVLSFFFDGNFDVEQDYMFFNTPKFNQDISQWNVSSGTNFVRNCLYFPVPF